MRNETSQRSEPDSAALKVEDFLKLCGGLAAFMYGQIGFAPQVDGVQIGPVG